MRRALSVAAVVALFALSAIAHAQTPDPEPVSIEHAGYTFEIPGEQPFVAYVRERSENLDGEWVADVPFARLAYGSFTALTPCDDVSVLCAPLRTRATEALSGAQVNDILILTEQKVDG